MGISLCVLHQAPRIITIKETEVVGIPFYRDGHDSGKSPIVVRGECAVFHKIRLSAHENQV